MIRNCVFAILASMLLAAPAARADEDLEEAGEEDVSVTSMTGSTSESLAERIPSVTRPVFVKEGRVELSIGAGMSLNDPFYDHAMPSASIIYHVFDSIWIGAGAEFYASLATTIPVAGAVGQKKRSYDRPQYGAHLDLAWSPFYGKLSLLAEHVLHFDTYVLLGGGMIGPVRADPSFAQSIAIGQHFFVSDWLAIRVELRDQIFELKRYSQSKGDGDLQNFISVTVSAGFFVPTTFEREAL